MAHIPVIFADDGMQADDVDEYTRAPLQSEADLSIVKDPASGSWNNLTALPGLDQLGYLVAKRSDGTKIRFVTANHPDGG